jgi:methenyltetrahydromethanopterin cyclohydrolase
MTAPTLNERAVALADRMAANVDDLRIAATTVAGARVIDCGVKTAGGIAAGLAMARVCLAGLADVSIAPGSPYPVVHVASDSPVAACMASQYAGWQVAVGKYFAMGSGPMRAAYGKEALFDYIPGRESPGVAVGVLETRKLPDESVVAWLAEKLKLPPERITLLVAPVTSLAGSVQVAARCLETALHKLHELHFDLARVVSGVGAAPLPGPHPDEMKAIGRTNDAILYGGRAVLYVRADDDTIAEVGPKVPSSASPDHGAPFAEIFARYGDFYKINPLLFAPAEVGFCNLATGRTHTFGRAEPEILARSFA